MDAKVSACTSYLPIPDEDDASSEHDDGKDIHDDDKEILEPSPVTASKPLMTAASKANTSSRRIKPSRTTSNSASIATYQWHWLSELVTIFKLIHGYHKLNHNARPNTAPIGNTDIINAINWVSEYLNLGLKPDLFMGRGTKIKQMVKPEFPITLSMLDDEAAIQDQWDVFK